MNGRFLIPVFFIFVLAGCKTQKKSTSRSHAAKHVTEEKKTSTGGAPLSVNKDLSYPASHYYGNSWNNDHVKINSTVFPEDVHLHLSPEGTNPFVMPSCGNILSEFGPRNGRMHTGIDIWLQMNDSVYCAFDGMVRMAKEYGGYGKMVVVRHENGLETLYSHLNEINVKLDQRVKAGDLIGKGGRTGNATTEHLHFETRFKGEPFNPRILIDFVKCNLLSDNLSLTRESYKLYYKNIRIVPAKETVAKHKEHFVEKGDTLFNISKRYGTTVQALKEYNKLSDDLIRIGQKLLIPAE